MSTLSTLRKRKAEDSPQGGQKSKHSKSMPGIDPNGHPRDAPKQIEVEEAPLPKHGKRLFIQASLFWRNEYGKNRQCQGKNFGRLSMHGGHTQY
jgi:hypothetical protein